jgi:hypothetical protein
MPMMVAPDEAERHMPEPERGFGVVRPLPVTRLPRNGETVVPPMEYASIASRPEPVRVAA